MREAELDSWYEEWRRLGDRVEVLARAAEAAGRSETARLAYLRACSYHRTSGVMLLGHPLDARVVTAHRAQKAAFQAAMRLTQMPVEGVEIPFEGARLPGYLFKPSAAAGHRATVILIGGYDGTCEELYFLTGAAALQRGYNVLAVDGPGQGSALLDHGLTLRVDWENVIAAMIDDLVARPHAPTTSVSLSPQVFPRKQFERFRAEFSSAIASRSPSPPPASSRTRSSQTA